MNDTLQKLLQSALQVGAGYLAGKGIIDASTTTELVSAGLAIAGLIWSIVHHKTAVATAAAK